MSIVIAAWAMITTSFIFFHKAFPNGLYVPCRLCAHFVKDVLRCFLLAVARNQVIMSIVIAAWAMITTSFIFLILHVAGLLRVSEEDEDLVTPPPPLLS